MKGTCVTIALFLCSLHSRAQAPGSVAVFGGPLGTVSIGTGGSLSTMSETVYVGPGTYTINGNWNVYCKQVVIDPAAVLTGTGTVRFDNPSVVGGAASASLVDGNYLSGTNAIDVNMELQNASGMNLSNIAFPAALTGAGFTNNNTTATIYVGKDLNLTVDGANVFLGSGVVGDLRFDADATVSGYRPARAAITNNSILSHVTKENFTSAFVFPVGIASGDYTPAQISNAAANTVSVSVQDYTASAAPEVTADPGPGGMAGDGMNRTWHIYAASSGISSTVNLQHNSATNQSGFVEGSHFVTQWGPTAPNTSGDLSVPFSTSTWQSNTSGAGATGTLSTSGSVAGSSMRSRVYSSGLATSTAAQQSYFSKSADPFHPLPLSLTNFSAQAEGCNVGINWSTGVATGVSAFKLMHSSNGQDFDVLQEQQSKGDNQQYRYEHMQAGSGLHYYKLQVLQSDGTYSYTDLKTVRISCASSLEASLAVYPNPVNSGELMNGKLESPVSGAATIVLVNTQGQIIYREPVQVSKGGNVFALNTRSLAAGMYYMYVQGLAGLQLSPVKISINN
jgi:hypothetical protein